MQDKANAVDTRRPDARSYFSAIRQLQDLRGSKNSHRIQLANEDGEIVTGLQWNLDKFRDYFSPVCYNSDLPKDLVTE